MTYRVGGKNQLILAPTNGRSWEKKFSNDNLSSLPDEFVEYDKKNLHEVLNCLSWQVGVHFRNKALQGFEDIDFSFMSFIQSGIGYRGNSLCLQLSFLSDSTRGGPMKFIEEPKGKLNQGNR